MTYKQACKRAEDESKNGYVQHVQVRVTPRTNRLGLIIGHKIDPQGYNVIDWHDNATVRSYEDGRLLY